MKGDSKKAQTNGSESTGKLVNVLRSMGAVNILASGGLKEFFTTASPLVPPVSLFVPTVTPLLVIIRIPCDDITTTTLKETRHRNHDTELQKPSKQKDAELAPEFTLMEEAQNVIDELDRSKCK
ncbi:hypothetical protein Tco_0787803 [Tanacetum coccineum]